MSKKGTLWKSIAMWYVEGHGGSKMALEWGGKVEVGIGEVCDQPHMQMIRAELANEVIVDQCVEGDVQRVRRWVGLCNDQEKT